MTGTDSMALATSSSFQAHKGHRKQRRKIVRASGLKRAGMKRGIDRPFEIGLNVVPVTQYLVLVKKIVSRFAHEKNPAARSESGVQPQTRIRAARIIPQNAHFSIVCIGGQGSMAATIHIVERRKGPRRSHARKTLGVLLSTNSVPHRVPYFSQNPAQWALCSKNLVGSECRTPTRGAQFMKSLTRRPGKCSHRSRGTGPRDRKRGGKKTLPVDGCDVGLGIVISIGGGR